MVRAEISHMKRDWATGLHGQGLRQTKGGHTIGISIFLGSSRRELVHLEHCSRVDSEVAKSWQMDVRMVKNVESHTW